MPHYAERNHKDNGCPTCGYGADVYYELDIDKLFVEIDEFSKTFQKGF